MTEGNLSAPTAEPERGFTPPFWEIIPLEHLTRRQWESLCDGCGRCCLYRAVDRRQTGVSYSYVACQYLDVDTAQCICYRDRDRLMPGCVSLSVKELRDPSWLPATCAYRLLREGKALKSWHPLVCGDPKGPRKAGIVVSPATLAE